MKNNGGFSNLDNDVIVWDPSLSGAYGAGIYQTLSATNNYVPTAGSPSSFYPDGVPFKYIQSGQAFFVHSANGAVSDGTVSFSEAAKYTGASVLANGADGGVGEDKQYLRAALYSATGLIIDGNAVVFAESYSNDIDADDALKILNSGENFAIKTSGKTLAVEGHAAIVPTDTVFYQMQNLQVKAYKFRFVPEAFHASIQAKLVDRFLNVTTNINSSDTTYYNFSVTANAASSAANRFMVVFSLQSPLPVKLKSITAKRNVDKSITINWAVDNEINSKHYLIERSLDGINFTAVGIQAAKNNAGGSFNYSFIDNKVSGNGYYYRIKNIDIDAKYAYSAIAKVSALDLEAATSVYPNPVVNKTINIQFTNQPIGEYSVVLISQSGQIVLKQTFTSTTENFIKTIYVDKSIAAGVYQLNVKSQKNDSIVKGILIN
jgi:hypothetical protein